MKGHWQIAIDYTIILKTGD